MTCYKGSLYKFLVVFDAGTCRFSIYKKWLGHDVIIIIFGYYV